MADHFNYYRILGVRRSAGQEEIKKAYRRLAKQYHPDLAGNAKEAEYFKVLKEAYEILSDPVKRKKHDDLLSGVRLVKQEIKRETRKESRKEKKHHFEYENKKGNIHDHEPPKRTKIFFYLVGLFFSVGVSASTINNVYTGDWEFGWLAILFLPLCILLDSLAGLFTGKAVLSDKLIARWPRLFRARF